jgi:alkylation response protein AidB-like acyl-CoA dehydrogenase
MSFAERAIDLETEERVLLEGFSGFAEKELRRLADLHAEGPVLPVELVRSLFQRLEEFGLISGLVPESEGGAGLRFSTYGLLFEELARSWPDLGLAVLIQSVGVSLLSAFASAEQKAQFLAPLLRGERIVCACISEPAAGSNVAEIQTRAVRDADSYLISGEKIWISNGGWADLAIVVCRTESGLSMLLADRAAGWTSRDTDKMGLHAASTAELRFDGVRVPVGNLVGDEGQGLRQTLRVFERARVLVGLSGVGIARAALEDALAYALVRRQHGKPIAGHQLIQAYLAEMATEIDAAYLLCDRALRLLERGVRCDSEASMAKWYATEMAVRVSSRALQIHGGVGITKEFRAERHFRNARILPIPDGTTEIQKLVIGRNLTRLSAFS